MINNIICPYNPLYLKASKNFNLAIKKFPKAIIFCFSEYDISNALRFVLSNNLPFRIRSCRHDYEGNSNINNGIVIDISNINYVLIDKNNNTAKLGAGITSGKMYSELVDRGYTIPSGTCSDVGFSSLTSCGGVGFASRLLGLSCDNLLEIEMINYEGKKLIANKIFNKDLFWAVKGGLASNFGIPVSLTYRITPISYVSTYIIEWDYRYFTDVTDSWQKFTPYTDPRLTTSLTYEKEANGNISLLSRGQFFGKKGELTNILTPLLRVAPIRSIEIAYVPYKDAIAKWNNPCTGPRKFKATGSFIYEPLSKDILDILNNEMIFAPKNSRQFYEFIGLNGNVSKIKSNETAFVHRNSLYLLEIESIWTSNNYRNTNVNWTNHIKKLLSTVGVGNYRGFTDFNIIDWQKQYYGNNYPKLRRVKSKYDPLNIFKFPQSIEPYYETII
ncbi:FAD-dependent oxidoreductase [Clostridium sp. UBA1056]|uniref:FAD-dependent oxidoreductase n=1 Tax=unclassified Clostridium TaxID=2614128 RepID=UPI003217D0C4